MKFSFLVYNLFFLVISTSTAFGQISKRQFNDLLEPNSTLITTGANYSLEKTSDQQFVIKRFNLENKQINYFATFTSEKCDTRHGLSYEKYDDGTLLAQGAYVNNKKEGKWLEGVTQSGIYKNGLKQGKWITTNEKNRIINEKQYLDGELDGKMLVFDTLGAIRLETIYKIGEILSSTKDTSHTESLPRFPGCETLELTEEERKQCAEKELLTFIYSRIKYPRRAVEEGIQGQALIQFVVEKDGSIGDIKPLRGISKEIKTECLRLLAAMPIWIPGTQDGEVVRVRYALPIKFKLE